MQRTLYCEMETLGRKNGVVGGGQASWGKRATSWDPKGNTNRRNPVREGRSWLEPGGYRS